MASGLYQRPVGIMNAPGGSCDKCRRPCPPDRLTRQDGMRKCPYCVRRHDKKTCIRINDKASTEYSGFAYFGGRSTNEQQQ